MFLSGFQFFSLYLHWYISIQCVLGLDLFLFILLWAHLVSCICQIKSFLNSSGTYQPFLYSLLLGLRLEICWIFSVCPLYCLTCFIFSISFSLLHSRKYNESVLSSNSLILTLPMFNLLLSLWNCGPQIGTWTHAWDSAKTQIGTWIHSLLTEITHLVSGLNEAQVLDVSWQKEFSERQSDK